MSETSRDYDILKIIDLDPTPTHVSTKHVRTFEITGVDDLHEERIRIKLPDREVYLEVPYTLDRGNGPHAGDRLIVYQDGYVSWCPAAVFERDYRPISVEHQEQPDPAPKLAGLDFGDAIAAMKRGAIVARAGWNGKGMWLALTPGSTIPAAAARSGACKALVEFEGANAVTILPHIDMRAADGNIVIGWLASQTDMLAEDWQLVAYNGASIAPPHAQARPVSSDEALFEQQLQVPGGTAPRLTPEDIDAAIADEWYQVVPGTVLTICALTLRNGFVVVGYDGPVSPENFDEEYGRQSARSNAREQIWRLEGYRLRSHLAALAAARPTPAPDAAQA